MTYRGLEIVKADAETICRIPRSLFEQIRLMDSRAVDVVYENASVIASGWVYVFMDGENIVGVLWFTVNIIEYHVFVYLCSLLPEYQVPGGVLERWVARFIFSLDIPEEYKEKIQWATDRPEIFEKYGLRRSEKVLMEAERSEIENYNRSFAGVYK